MCAVHTAPDFRLKVNFPPSFPTPRSWTLMHMWGRFLFFICPEQVPSLRARQPRFLLLVPPHVFLPWKNRPPPTSPHPVVLLRPGSSPSHPSFLMGTSTLVHHHQKAIRSLAAHRGHLKPAVSLSLGTILSPQ